MLVSMRTTGFREQLSQGRTWRVLASQVLYGDYVGETGPLDVRRADVPSPANNRGEEQLWWVCDWRVLASQSLCTSVAAGRFSPRRD